MANKLTNKSQNKLMDIMKKIINKNNEFRPTKNDKRWRIKNDIKIMKCTKYYEIDMKLIKLINKYTEIYKKVKDERKYDIIDKIDDNVAIIYLVENDITGEKYIGYTTNPLYIFIKLNIHQFNLNNENVFDNFDYADNIDHSNDPNKYLMNFTFEIIEYVLYSDRRDLLERKKHYKKIYSTTRDKLEKILIDAMKGGSKMDKMDKLYEKRIPIFFEIIGSQIAKFESFKGYIYKLKNIKNKKVFICGYHKKLTKKILLKILNNKDNLKSIKRDIKKYGRRNFKLELVETHNAKSFYDFLFRIDFLKIKHKSLSDGYNEDYSIGESKLLFGKRLATGKKRKLTRSLFLKIQMYLFENNFEDNNDYKNIYGFVYQIRNEIDKKRFISYSHMTTIKRIVLGMYQNAIKGNVKHSKILKALEENTWDTFTYKILKKKSMDDTKISLDVYAEKMIKKYNTVDNGYNIDNKKLRRNIAIAQKYRRK